MAGQTRFKDRVILVTGATSGIGRCCARKLLEEGAKVVAAGRRQERLDQLAAEAAAAGEHLSTKTRASALVQTSPPA
jgi:NADP-dependent 3-hydroxy acid dehydrogenase YdfG